MKKTLVSRFVAVGISLFALGSSLSFGIDPQALAQEKGCFACHAIDHKVVGPAWKDVAKKYRGNKDAVNILVDHIIHGNSGLWGPLTMPPYPMPKEQATALAKFILSLH